MVDLADFSSEFYEMATNNLDNIQFDAMNFEQLLNDNALQFLSFKIF